MYIWFKASAVGSSETLWTLTLRHSNISFIQPSSNERRVWLLVLTTHTCPAEEEDSRRLPPPTASPAPSLHPKLPPFISLRLLAISAASPLPLPLHSPLSLHCQFAPPWAFFGSLGFVSSIRLGRPNFILYRIPLVWIHTHTHTHRLGTWDVSTHVPQLPESQWLGERLHPAASQHLWSRFQALNSSSISTTTSNISSLNASIFVHHRNKNILWYNLHWSVFSSTASL